MKHRYLLALLALVAFLTVSCNGAVPPSGYVSVDTIDPGKALTNPQASWVIHAYQPTEETIRAKRYWGSTVAELSALETFLGKILREDARPSTEILRHSTIPVQDLWDDNDYLLLHYSIRTDYKITVEDGQKFWLLVRVMKPVPLSQAQELVKTVATNIFNLTEVPEKYRGKPLISVECADLGSSMSGRLYMGYSPLTQMADWFTSMRWWSDGRQILYHISKIDFVAMSKRASGGPPVVPRKFGANPLPTAPREFGTKQH